MARARTSKPKAKSAKMKRIRIESDSATPMGAPANPEVRRKAIEALAKASAKRVYLNRAFRPDIDETEQ